MKTDNQSKGDIRLKLQSLATTLQNFSMDLLNPNSPEGETAILRFDLRWCLADISLRTTERSAARNPRHAGWRYDPARLTSGGGQGGKGNDTKRSKNGGL